ncbi:copper transport protein CCH-like [Olea europaea var. sylvestris]|uniref:copper transport protein CCH-like n=1 Tax=Olea europaea var. sylvestris TaxID=158386 RepID=UPI000C1D7AE7|nr:copper transport protein CCH-like [Olea europaea var. sylvestris]
MSQTVVLKVGMSCQGCVGAVKRVLGKMEGVESFDIDIEQQKVTVKGNVQPEAVLQTVSKTGKVSSFWEAAEVPESKPAETPAPLESKPAEAPESKPAETPAPPESKPAESPAEAKSKPAETPAEPESKPAEAPVEPESKPTEVVVVA